MDNETLLDGYAAYLRGQALADATIRNRISALRTLAGHCTSLHEATIFELRGFMGRRDIKRTTLRTYRVAIQGFYSYLVEDGYREDDPARRLSPIHAPRGNPRPFTLEQINRMLTSGAYWRSRAMMLLGYYQGFRVSQIARVRGEDIDLLSMTIRTVAKGSKEGVLPLHPVIADLARKMPRKGWWFPARDGRDAPIKPQSVTDLISRAIRRAGITDPRLTPHSLRHSFGTHLIEAGVDVRVVQSVMMHESLATTQIYTRVSDHMQRSAIVALPVRALPKHSGRMAA